MATAEAPLPGAAKHGRFVALDAMRGVAALFVVARHVGPYVPRFSYLAVDVFFVMSGFVLAFANDRRFAAGQTPMAFLKARVIRLYPLYGLGLLVGLVAALVADPAQLSWPQTLITTAFEALGLPGLNLLPHHTPFPVNGVLWSIFFEFWIANLILALGWRQLHGARLGALIAVCAAGLVVCTKRFHSLDLGYTWDTLPAGCARVGFSFFAGVALFRLHSARPARLKIPSGVVMLVLALALSAPLEGRVAHLYELACVILLFPALVYFGASTKERNPRLGALLGDSSYAAYAIHRPLVELTFWTIATFNLTLPATLPAKPLILLLGQLGFVAAVGVLAYVLDRYYDAPSRALWRGKRVRELAAA